MHFKHPELLYFLGLLVIPIIIHLFQWRKFKVEYFTNVKLLQKLSIQTRKSSKLKKYLLLFTRCLLFLALIFAFAKPFFKAKDSTNEQNKLYVVLDNSHSMQAKGKTGELMLSAVNQLILETPENYEISILTNDDAYWNTNVKTIRTQLLETNYSPNAFNLNQAINKIKAQKDSNKKDILVLTDNVNQKIENQKNNDNFQFFYKEYEAEKTSNVAIDRVFLSNTLDNFYEVSVVLKNYGEHQENIPLVIYNNEKVVAKSIENFNFKQKTLKFNLPKESINARINIEDNSLSYDNDYYFNIKSPKKTNILNIGNVSKSLHFNRIFVPQEFNFNSIEESSINASFFENNSVIILNEIKNLDKNLQKQVLTFLENGGNLIFIPSVENDLKTLNDFFGNLNINWQKSKNSNLKITNISFDHPLYQNVFEKKITNFVYPSCKESFVLKNSSPTILEYENGTAFLKGIKKNNGMLYVFAGAISEPNSNFKNSQLIVPTLYNMTRNNETTGFSALNIGQESPYFLDLKLNKEEIVSIRKEGEKYIPNQQIIQNKVKLNFYDEPKKAGNYQVFLEDKAVDNISFNYPKSESNLLLKDRNNYDDFEEISSLNTFFNDLKTNRSNTSYWKFFVVLALLCILAEVLIQKFVK